MKKETVEKLIKLASSRHPADGDEFTPDDVGGGNIDDAFYSGERYGSIVQAREILDLEGITYEIET